MRRGLLLLLCGLCLGCAARTRELVVLLPEAGHAGQVQIATATAPAETLTQPYAALKTTERTVQVLTLPAQTVQTLFGAVWGLLPVPAQTFTLYFDAGGTRLAAGSQATVFALLEAVRARGVAEVEITGHTDTVGELERNDALALERATLTQRLLDAAGLPPAFVRVVGRGERAPRIPTPDETDEPRNRRVEVLVR